MQSQKRNRAIQNVLVVGGYGGVGKYVVEYLIKHFNFHVIIGGRNKQKALTLQEKISFKYPESKPDVAIIDATDKNSLLSNFKGVDLAIITATVPDQMAVIAEAAIESTTDLIDILIRGDVLHTLSKFEQRIIDKERVFITQCGFHPGIIAPLIRIARSHFDQYEEAKVMMAMDGIFEQPEAIKEILHEVIKSDAQILVNKVWKKANFKNAESYNFGEYFGQKECYPTKMTEILGIEKKLGLKNCAVYSAGFDAYIDKFIFPLAVILGFFNRKMSLNICSKLFYNRIKSKSDNTPKTKIVLHAKGKKLGQEKEINIGLSSENSFELTAMAITALIKQYKEGSIREKGLYLMGQIANEEQLFQDLNSMGVPLKTEQIT